MRFTKEHLLKVLTAFDAQLAPHKATAKLMLFDLPHYQLVHCPHAEPDGTSPALEYDAIRRAYDTAVARSGVRLPMIQVQTTDLPFLFETRLNPAPITGLKHLSIQLVDRHDVLTWYLLKNDKRAVAEVQSLGHASNLSFDSLMNSFCASDAAHPGLRSARSLLLALVQERFGKTCEIQAESILSERLG